VQIKNLTIGYRSKKKIKTIYPLPYPNANANGNDNTNFQRSITASLCTGELACLLGANGIGKSTLLRTLSGFLPKLSGDIVIRGQSIDRYSCKDLSEIIGIVLTEKTEVQNFTAKEMVAMGRFPYTNFWGKLNRDDNRIVDQALELVKITHLSHRHLQTLSDGERQKVVIAKALAQETPIIYLDEPTAFLDYPSKVEIMRLLLQLAQKTDKTIFLSSHDIELALQFADQIWLMSRLNGITVGTPEELSMNGDFNSLFEGFSDTDLFHRFDRYVCRSNPKV